MKHILQSSILFIGLFFSIAVSAQTLEKVYILNEGAFNNSNASVTSFNPVTNQVSQNIFFNTNGRVLGDISNYSALINEKLYIIVSNSNKIEVVNPESFASEAIIFVDDFGGSSPAFIQQVSDSKAYITNLTGNHVSILNLNTNAITGSIEVGNNPEGIAVSNGKAYVAVNGFGSDNKLAVIDISTDEVIKTLTVHDNPRQPVVDENGFVWVISTGDYGFDDDFNYDPDLETFGEIHIIDPEEDVVTDIIEIGGHPARMAMDFENGLIYISNDGIQVVEMENRMVQDELLSSTNYYSVFYWHGDEPGLFATKVPDFSSSGSVDILNVDGSLRQSFTAGIGPSFVQFIFDETSTSVPHTELAEQIRLHQNYPNPFNPTTSIRFELSDAMDIKLEVFNVLGQRVAILSDGFTAAGQHTVSFSGQHLPSGMYAYRLQTGTEILTRKMMLVK